MQRSLPTGKNGNGERTLKRSCRRVSITMSRGCLRNGSHRRTINFHSKATIPFRVAASAKTLRLVQILSSAQRRQLRSGNREAFASNPFPSAVRIKFSTTCTSNRVIFDSSFAAVDPLAQELKSADNFVDFDISVANAGTLWPGVEGSTSTPPVTTAPPTIDLSALSTGDFGTVWLDMEGTGSASPVPPDPPMNYCNPFAPSTGSGTVELCSATTSPPVVPASSFLELAARICQRVALLIAMNAWLVDSVSLLHTKRE